MRFLIPCLLLVYENLTAEIFPIPFSIPEEKVISYIPEKDLDFAQCIPGDVQTYIFTEEAGYYRSYQRAYYGLTQKKAGWDCLRHYEILANGCIPYFVGLELCDPQTLAFLPKNLILEAMQIPGVSYLSIDHSVFDRSKYNTLLEKLLTYTRKHLTSRKVAEYLLSKSEYSGTGPVLYLTQDQGADYLRCLTFIGLRQALGANAIDVPRILHLYKDYPTPWITYGKGMSYTCILDPILIDRSDIETRIRNHEFELIIYGSVHRGLPFHDLVTQCYFANKIVYMCGEDCHWCEYAHQICPKNSPIFLRELTVN